MAEFTACIHWARNGAPFTGADYSRAHEWHFDGGVVVPASSSPHSVPLPHSRADAVDPEEALIAALASCHMLFFLAVAAKRGYVVERYVDNPVGVLGRNARGRTYMERVTLRPAVTFAGKAPGEDEIAAFHHQSHDLCYIANSVLTDVRVEPAGTATS